MGRQRVVIIGAGVGGLTCAIDLARAGFAVTVVERAECAGGKMREIEVDGARVDAGPTVLTLRWVFDELFEAAGANLNDHVQLYPLAILARHAWNEMDRLDLFADIGATADAIGALAGPGEAAGYRAFCAESQRIYETLRGSFLTRQKAGPVALAQKIGLTRIGALMGIRPFETLWQALGAHFEDPRLRQLFGRYATYCGSSPFAAPATLMLIAHVEQQGVWCVEGGMQRLAEALEQLALSLGATFRYRAHAAQIHVANGRVSAVTLADDERMEADWVVVNADSAALANGALGDGVKSASAGVRPAQRSLSAVTWAVRTQTGGFPLSRHNVFFSGDYAAEFDDLFKSGRLPGAPTIYVCAQDRADGSDTVAGEERLLLLVNAPPHGDRSVPDERDLTTCEKQVTDHLARCGLALSRPLSAGVRTTPRQFNAMFPATGGALYGRATHGWGAAFERPGAASNVPGLYRAGGGAHPGAGIPMAALSGRLAAQQLIGDHASANRSRPGVTLGGISTR